MNIKDAKIREKIGVFLLCMILILAGAILVNDKSASAEVKSISEKPVTSTSDNNNNESQKNISQTQVKQEGNKININTASLEELDILPGIGEKTAEKIIEYRDTHNGFNSLEEIKEVSGIGDSKYNQIKDLISI